MLEGMEIQENVPLAPLTTFGIGGAARYFAEAKTEDDIVAALAWAQERALPVFVLGGGSNLLVRDEGFAGLVVKIGVMGVEALGVGGFEVGAGESWDGFVESMLSAGMAGVECMAGIPGSVGGTPVQNVGAYGQEVSETIESVRAYDRKSGAWVTLSKDACRFRYRESVFNKDEPGRFLVTKVRFRLRPGGVPTLKYAELQRRFPEGSKPTLREVAETVRAIRREKGMLIVEGDPDCRSAGSFFKNPIVAAEALERIAAALQIGVDAVPNWPAGEGKVKVPAAWLLERAGFTKGYTDGRAGISSRHTLALTNRGGATCADVLRLQEHIVAAVAEKFGVQLEREPVLLG
jgi:UDP-N-acetylmuramate dehydrogenase